MTEEDALIAAIKAAPNDDLPRLVYADWLDERGAEGDAERAEFIRLHIACHGKLILMTTEEGERIVATLQRLIHDDCVGLPLNWLGFARDALENRDLLRPGQHRAGNIAGFSRGFVEAVRCPAESWLKDGDAIVAKHPVQRVRLTTNLMTVIDDFRHIPTVAYFQGMPPLPQETIGVVRPGESLVDNLLRAYWPGIAFELPGIEYTQPIDPYTWRFDRSHEPT